MDEFEKQWSTGALSGSPDAMPGATPKETARYNWRRCLLFIQAQIFEHEDALDVIEEELSE